MLLSFWITSPRMPTSLTPSRTTSMIPILCSSAAVICVICCIVGNSGLSFGDENLVNFCCSEFSARVEAIDLFWFLELRYCLEHPCTLVFVSLCRVSWNFRRWLRFLASLAPCLFTFPIAQLAISASWSEEFIIRLTAISLFACFAGPAMDKRVEICYAEAFGIQSCLAENDFQMAKCRNSILELQECCKHAQYKTKHCASVTGILAMTKKKPENPEQPRPN